jgi:cytochrome d ubiquinol oxidase subunit I
MNHPTGFTLVNGQVADVHPWSALFANPYLPHEIAHMYLAGYIVTGFLVAAAYAWGRLRGRWGRYEQTALAIPLAAAALAAPLQVVVGDWSGRDVAAQQPVKLAAFEGLAQTTRGAPVHLLGWYDGTGVKYGIPVPRLLSLLAFHHPNATVEGLDTVPPAQRPPVNVVRFAFQTMVGIGFLLAALGVYYVAVRLRRGRLPTGRWFYGGIVLAGPLSLVALIAGWITTEVGRQPWIVYEHMTTAAAVTGAGGVPVGYATIAVVYAVLAAAVWWVLRRLARSPIPEPHEDAAPLPAHAR